MPIGQPAEVEWEPPSDEELRVYTWRRERFCEIGFNQYQADALIDAGVDWHEAERVTRKVGDVGTAFDILS